jgi:hypothetical protein
VTTYSWFIAHRPESCGCCTHRLKPGDKVLEWKTGAARRIRCQPCGEKLFGACPDTVPDGSPASRQPLLVPGSAPTSQPFVTVEEIANRQRARILAMARKQETA